MSLHLTCRCGHWLLEWGRPPARVWCAGVSEGLAYQEGHPTTHDVYSLDGQRLVDGTCRSEIMTRAPSDSASAHS